MKGQYYLATTGISKIWDFDAKLLLLGPWCLASESNTKLLKGREYTLIPSPWKPATKIKIAADYCYELYEELMPILSERLNVLHGVDYSIKYWRILIGYWLFQFIEVLYDRFKRIENTIKEYPDFYSHVLPVNNCRLTTRDTYDLISSQMNEDYYNYKLFSLVMYQLCPEKIIQQDVERKVQISEISTNRRQKILCRFIGFFDVFSQSRIVLSDMYHMRTTDILALKGMNGSKRISIRHFDSLQTSLNEADRSFRGRLKLKDKDVDGLFNKLVYNLVPDALPTCFVEQYHSYRKNNNLTHPLQAVGSATGWYYNEQFKYFASEALSKGARIAEFQHGGGFGFALVEPKELLSLEKDVFYTWGWKSDRSHKTIPLASPYLSRLRNTHQQNINNILFIGTTSSHYLYEFRTSLQPDDMQTYYEHKKIFFHSLSDDLIRLILYRPHSVCDWKEKEFIRQFYPDIEFLEHSPLVDWMKKARLVVIDNAHTSFLEALTINVPSIFYWDHDVYVMRSDADDYFALLREAGIVYRDPQSAAKKVNEIYNNSAEWWQQPKIQKARNRFCEHFALACKDWADEWGNILKSL